MEMGLRPIANSIVDSILKTETIKKTKKTGVAQYKRDLQSAIAVIASDSLDYARKKMPNGSKVKFMEDEHTLLLGEFEKLPLKVQKKIRNQVDLIVITQVADLEKAAAFQHSASISSSKSMVEARFDMIEKTDKYRDGNAIAAGSHTTAATTVNNVRNAFHATPAAMEQIVAFKFVNDNPKTPICIDLNGTIYSKDDPDHFKYTAPLHFNCDSYNIPIYKLKKGEEIKKIKPSTAKLEATIQF